MTTNTECIAKLLRITIAEAAQFVREVQSRFSHVQPSTYEVLAAIQWATRNTDKPLTVEHIVDVLSRAESISALEARDAQGEKPLSASQSIDDRVRRPPSARHADSAMGRANWWLQQQQSQESPTSPAHRLAPKMVETRVKGVTYEGRQRVVAKLTVGEELLLRREANNPYDSNAVRIERRNGEQVGYVDRALAARLAPILDTLAVPVAAIVTRLDGGLYPGSNLGVQVRFPVPEDIRPAAPSQSVEEY